MRESIRSFISFDIDNKEVLKKINNIQNILVRTGSNLKIVKPENIHVTIRFLGDILPHMIDRIFEEMQKVHFTHFDIKIHGIGVFPHLRYPRIVWAGMTEGSSQMRDISNRLQPGLHNLGFAPDAKGFSPHLTIARVKTGRNKAELVQCINENSNLEFGTVRAKCLRLKRSDLTPQGPIYSTLKEFCPEK